MATKVLTDPQHYTNIANAIREKNGTSNTYTPSEMANAILEIETGSGASLDHTVTFKDSDGNIVAIYSVMDGVGNIAKPSGITATGWIDSDGQNVEFPINPVSDMILSSFNAVGYVDKLYSAAKLNKSDYPIVFIGSYNASSVTILFGQSAIVGGGVQITTPRVGKDGISIKGHLNEDLDNVIDSLANYLQNITLSEYTFDGTYWHTSASYNGWQFATNAENVPKSTYVLSLD